MFRITTNSPLRAIRAPSNARTFVSKAQFVGRLGNAPEKNQTTAGAPYYRYNLAVSKPVKKDSEGKPVLDDQGYPVRESSWFTVFNFNERAGEALEKLKAGSLVYVEANIDTLTSAPDANGPGQKQYVFRELSHRVLSKPKDQ